MSSPSDSDHLDGALLPLLTRTSAPCFIAPNFQPSQENAMEIIQTQTRVLVVGAGGLGCEILKDLALSGFTDIHVIDLDTIDVSNLNRQFLFRTGDINKPKSEIAANFIMRRCPHVSVQWHTKPIQQFSSKWYSQFDIVIAGLDNIEARQWLNETLVNLVSYDETGAIDLDTVIPLIDGGTEGFGGQARVFLPRITSCFECSLVSMPPQTGFAVCTIRNVPRLPEHCIVYALKMQWPLLIEFHSVNDYRMYEKKHPTDEYMPSGVTLDKDDVNHMTWLYNRAQERANEFGINGVTYNLTMQVVKNIIPAIASTNALISAACVNEALKYRSGCSLTLDNYFMYIGGSQTGTNTETIKYKRNPDCVVCHPPRSLTIDPMLPFSELITALSSELALEQASLSNNGTILYLPNLHEQYASNLECCIGELIDSGAMCVANDKKGRTMKIIIIYQQ